MHYAPTCVKLTVPRLHRYIFKNTQLIYTYAHTRTHTPGKAVLKGAHSGDHCDWSKLGR